MVVWRCHWCEWDTGSQVIFWLFFFLNFEVAAVSSIVDVVVSIVSAFSRYSTMAGNTREIFNESPIITDTQTNESTYYWFSFFNIFHLTGPALEWFSFSVICSVGMWKRAPWHENQRRKCVFPFELILCCILSHHRNICNT